MKHIYRFIKHLLTLIFVLIPLELLGIPLLALVLLFVPHETTSLPRLFQWWDNYDGVIDGTGDYLAEHQNGSIWWRRFNWLALRNPLNYFQYQHMGCRPPLTPTTVIHDGKETLENGGHSYKEVYQNDEHKRYYEYIYEKKYTLFGNPGSFRFRLGWKLAGTDHNGVYQWVLQIIPFKPE
jgi:hypothetical protein